MKTSIIWWLWDVIQACVMVVSCSWVCGVKKITLGYLEFILKLFLSGMDEFLAPKSK